MIYTYKMAGKNDAHKTMYEINTNTRQIVYMSLSYL